MSRIQKLLSAWNSIDWGINSNLVRYWQGMSGRIYLPHVFWVQCFHLLPGKLFQSEKFEKEWNRLRTNTDQTALHAYHGESYHLFFYFQDPMDFCLSARDSGPCNNFEKRYGYDANTDTCVEYQYGGCEGTLNNFHSLQRCTEICCKEYKRRHRL